MTAQERCNHYIKAYPQYPSSWPYVRQEQGRDCIYAIWVIGNDYRNKSKLYGAYPNGYLARIMALYPDAEQPLHVFSGSLPKGEYWRIDSVNRTEDGESEQFIHRSVYDITDVFGPDSFNLLLADPPYSDADAEKYQTPMVDRRRVMQELAKVTVQGGHLVWLDTVWPMHSKTQWVTVGRIAVIRSTNHRVRVAHIFERM